MLSSKSLSLQTASLSRPACATFALSRRPQRSSALRVRAIGSVNDPEKVKKNKQKKEQDSEWAEPKNKNPLEKKPIIRGDPGRASEQEGGGNPLEGAKQAVEGAVDKAKEAVEGVKKAGSN